MSIGIIGTGWGTRVQVPAFRSAGLDVVALAARDQQKTQQQAQDLGIPFATTDWRELLARPDVQFVSIVVPPSLHKEIALAAMDAGKHVLCEKPMAMNAAQTEAMVEAALAHPNLYAIIDHELRFLPALQLAQQRVHSGELGALRHVETTVIGGGRADPNRAWNWWSDETEGGGLLGAIGSHQIDTLHFLFGPITAVSGVLNTFVTERPAQDGPRPVTADDYASLLVRFGDGGLGAITMSVVAGVNEPSRLTAHFENGALRFESGRLLIAKRGAQWEDITPDDTVDIPQALQRGGEFQRGSVYIGHALKRALAGDCGALAPAATFQDGHRTQRVLDAVRRSHANGSGWIQI
jgi:predicted dehydrogenase